MNSKISMGEILGGWGREGRGLCSRTVDPDKTPHSAVSDHGLYCLLRPVCPNIKDYYSIFNIEPVRLIILIESIRLDVVIYMVIMATLGSQGSQSTLKKNIFMIKW